MYDILTLRGAYETYHKSAAHAEETTTKYRDLMKWWERLTADPPVDQITNRMLKEFQAGLLSNGLARSTVNSYLAHLTAILSTIGPASPSNPFAEGVIDTFPRVRRLKVKLRLPRVVPDEALLAIYRGCESARWPIRLGIDPTDWWRALSVFLYNVGTRTGDFRALKCEDISLRRQSLKLMAKKSDQQERVIPLHDSVVEHLERIWRPPRALVFPTSDKRMDQPSRHTPKQLYEHWYRIQAYAGLPKPGYTFQEFRKTCCSVLFERSPGAANAMLGHASMTTTERFYANTERTLLETAMSTDQPWTRRSRENDPKPAGRRLRVIG
ncbi:MAG: tyrosine-type recombinase/integrase [Planctomycetota bacterium]|jgi:integrase